MQQLGNHSSTASRTPEEQEGNVFPIHPRQATRTGNGFQAVFEALMRLLPPASELGRAGAGGGGVDGGSATNGAAVGVMQRAALRCGDQCRRYIRALQRGIEVGMIV